jgi:SAM-dependent methyltransferase
MLRSTLVACAASTVSGLNLFSQFMPRSLTGFPTEAKSVEAVLDKLSFPKDSPFQPEDFSRQDESVDTQFYDTPRFCYHVDDQAVAALTRYYSTAFRAWDKPAILDICASHVSHFPEDVAAYAGRRVALGMNEVELRENRQVDEYVVKDLNTDPSLPFEDASFDIVTNVVSIDYLTQPLAICKEVARVLKPGGAAIFALSNRCFPTKAVNIWLKTNDLEHVYVVGSYFHYAGGFKPPSAVEVSPNQATTPWAGGSSQNNAYLAVVKATVDK